MVKNAAVHFFQPFTKKSTIILSAATARQISDAGTHATKLGPQRVEPPTQRGWLPLQRCCNAAASQHDKTSFRQQSDKQWQCNPPPTQKKQNKKQTDVPYLVASILPPMTAMPVHKECPITPPAVTPKGSFVVANAIVAICERSPHSAKKVIVNDIVITYKSKAGTGRRVRRRLRMGAYCLDGRTTIVVSDVSPCTTTKTKRYMKAARRIAIIVCAC